MGIKVFEVNFSNYFDPYWFRLLYPQIKIHNKSRIIAGKYLLSTVSYNENYYPECQSLFLRSFNGVNLEQPLGLHSFLERTDYLSKSKLKKLKYHFPLDSQISVQSLPVLFKEIQHLKMTNKFPKKDSLESVFDFYKKPFHDRILVSKDRVSFLLKVTLKFIKIFYLYKTDLHANQVRGYQEFFKRFQIRDFQKKFIITDSEYNDFLYLQTFFK